MTIHEFDLLKDIEKEEIVLNKGTFLSTQHNNDKMFDTYKLASFFVQFHYNIQGYDNTNIISFADPDELLCLSYRSN
ncbi:MAG: hypothetical protein WKF89_04080 [Chitinophagaceae bacterium]